MKTGGGTYYLPGNGNHLLSGFSSTNDTLSRVLLTEILTESLLASRK